MAPDAPATEILRRGRCFAALPPALQARMAERAMPRRLRTGQYLLRQGDPPRGLFGVLHGRTRPVCAVGEDRELLTHVGGPGLWTGECPLPAGGPSIGSVIADAPALALRLGARHWQRIVAAVLRWLQPFAALLAERFATAFGAHADVQAMTRDEGVHARLKRVAEMERAHGSTASRIRLSQALPASMPGLSRQTLNGSPSRLQRRGLLRVGFRMIELAE
jgi:CRP-like cAMP-binding protein